MYFRTGRHAPSELQKTSCEYEKSGEFSEYKMHIISNSFHSYTICIGSAAHWKTRHVEYFIAVLWVSKYDKCQGLMVNETTPEFICNTNMSNNNEFVVL